MLIASINRDRRIGVEVEMAIPRLGRSTNRSAQETLARLLTRHRLPAVARRYSHRPVPPNADVAVERDNSVQGNNCIEGVAWHQIEVKTRILQGIDDWECIVPRTMSICGYFRPQTPPETCGMHIHLDLPEVRRRPAVVASLFALVWRYEKVIYGLVPACRRQNGYADPLPDLRDELRRCRTTKGLQRALCTPFHYCGLNLGLVLLDRPRVEIRYHGATLDSDQARHWTQLWLQLIEHAVTRRCKSGDQVHNDRDGIRRLLTCTGFLVNKKIYSTVDPELRETGRYLLRRWQLLNDAKASRNNGAGHEGESRRFTQIIARRSE